MLLHEGHAESNHSKERTCRRCWQDGRHGHKCNACGETTTLAVASEHRGERLYMAYRIHPLMLGSTRLPQSALLVSSCLSPPPLSSTWGCRMFYCKLDNLVELCLHLPEHSKLLSPTKGQSALVRPGRTTQFWKALPVQRSCVLPLLVCWLSQT